MVLVWDFLRKKGLRAQDGHCSSDPPACASRAQPLLFLLTLYTCSKKRLLFFGTGHSRSLHKDLPALSQGAFF